MAEGERSPASAVKDKLLDAFNASDALPAEERDALLSEPEIRDRFEAAVAAIHAYEDSREERYRRPPEGYVLYVPYTDDPMAHGRKWFSDRIKFFGAPEDRIYQDDIRRFDPKWLDAVASYFKRLRREGKSELKMADVIKPGSARNTKDIESMDPEKVAEIGRVTSVIRTRKHREKQSRMSIAQ